MARVLIRLRGRTKNSNRLGKGYALKPGSFLFSVALHGGIIALALLTPAGRSPDRPLYEGEIQPYEKKIIWYHLNEILPEIAAPARIGTEAKASGEVKAPQTVIATSTDSPKSTQIVYQPAPELKLEQEIKAPNLVAASSLPNFQRPAPKQFVAPAPAPSQSKPPEPLKLMSPPPDLANQADVKPLVLDTAATRFPPRRFVVPTPDPKPKIPTPNPTAIDAPPQLKQETTDLPGRAVSAPGSSPVFAPPPPADRSALAGVTAAVVGLHPSDNAPVIPPGSRQAQFSQAPQVGKAATGEIQTARNSPIPDLTISGGAGNGRTLPPLVPDPKAKKPEDSKSVLYQQIAGGPVPSTLSAPLRPGSRTIPAALETRFQGRSVYTLVIPAPKLPEYGGDWIVWFAERQPVAEGTSQIKAPLPNKKVVAAGENAAPRTGFRVQLAAIVRKDGHLEGIQVIRGGAPGLTKAVIDDLMAWEFRPATRNGVPIDVEVVFEIPFRINQSQVSESTP